jgi:hypothetical protein
MAVAAAKNRPILRTAPLKSTDSGFYFAGSLARGSGPNRFGPDVPR